MNTQVVILAQGSQQRMGDATGGVPKQLLPLPACGGQPILGRTLRQLELIAPPPSTRITLVAWHEVARGLFIDGVRLELVSLPQPGNSSLKGIDRYLETLALTAGVVRPDRIIVLLGDVVYSWACLEAIFADLSTPGLPGAYEIAGRINPPPQRPDHLRCRFVGTSDISPSGGELWGIAWQTGGGELDAHDVMTTALEYALKKHPPYHDTYQPGQLRRWMWALHPSYQTTSRYTAIDDYTRDIDLPEHLQLLGGLSEQAARDDREHGMVW